MALELKINKELGNLNATAFTAVSLIGVVNNILEHREFLALFNTMFAHLCEVYEGVCNTLEPICNLRTETEFAAQFDRLQTQYQEVYLAAASQPRKKAESAHECYLELATFPQMKTSYPLLKQSFATLYTFMDKWITNDAWMVMSADGVFKSVNRWLAELSHLKKQDIDEAWLVYRFGIMGFRTNVASLRATSAALSQLCAPAAEPLESVN